MPEYDYTDPRERFKDLWDTVDEAIEATAHAIDLNGLAINEYRDSGLNSMIANLNDDDSRLRDLLESLRDVRTMMQEHTRTSPTGQEEDEDYYRMVKEHNDFAEAERSK